MKTLFLALFCPVQTFNQLKTEPFSVMSLVILLLFMLLNLILMIPINAKVISLTFSSMSLPADQIDSMIQITHKMRYLQVAGSEITYIAMFLFYALLLYILVYFAKYKLNYMKALQLIVCSYFIAAIGDLVNTALLYVRGLDAIQNMYDTPLLGLNMLTSVEQVGATLYTFLSCFTPFQLAFAVLLSIGLKIFTEIKYAQALFITVLLWLATTVMPTLSVYFSELKLAESGIM